MTVVCRWNFDKHTRTRTLSGSCMYYFITYAIVSGLVHLIISKHVLANSMSISLADEFICRIKDYKQTCSMGNFWNEYWLSSTFDSKTQYYYYDGNNVFIRLKWHMIGSFFYRIPMLHLSTVIGVIEEFSDTLIPGHRDEL